MSKRVLSFMLSLVLIVGLIPRTSVFAENAVSINVKNNPNIDIAVSTKKTTLDMSNFETDVKNKLKSLGIDPSNVNVQLTDTAVVDTNSSDASIIFNTWGKIGANCDWSLYDDNGTQTVNNATNGEMSGFYANEPDSFDIKDIVIEFDMNAYDGDDDVIGVFFRFNITQDSTDPNAKKATGYIINEGSDTTKSGAQSGAGGTHFGAATGLYKIQNESIGIINSETATATSTPHRLARHTGGWWPRYRYIHYKVEIRGNTFRGWRRDENGNDIQFMNFTDPNPIQSGSYGFMSYSQKARFKNFSATYQVFRDFATLLSQPKWRPDAYHFIVNVDNNVDASLNNPEVLSKTLSDEIHLVQWGTNTNKASVESFIAKNDGHGKYIPNSDYTAAVNQTADYIKSVIKTQVDNEYIILGSNNEINVTPANLKNNATTSEFPSGCWRIEHEYDYFENNLGQLSSSGVYTPNLTCPFDKPGKYDIYYCDSLIKTIYVHRSPVADFTVTRNPSTAAVTLVNKSIDDDVLENNGIKSEKWFYKLESATNWTQGKLTNAPANTSYMIKLEVTDFQGQTASAVKYVGKGNPVASFTINEPSISKWRNLIINETSYDPVGNNITKREWTLRKNGVAIGTYTNPITNFNASNLGAGNYTYTLKVTNSNGVVSQELTRSFEIVEDTDLPVVIEVTPKTSTQYNVVANGKVSIKVADNNSGLAKFEYKITQSTATPTSWNSFATLNGEKTDITKEHTFSVLTTATDGVNLGQGKNIIHFKVTDKAGNVKTKQESYNIDTVKPLVNGHNFEEISSSIRPGIFKTNKPVHVTMDISDATSGIDNFVYILPDDDTEYDGSINNGKYTFLLSNEVDGDIAVIAQDKAGNKSLEYIISDLIIDKTPPVITISDAPDSNYWVKGNDTELIDIDVSATDSSSGIQYTEYSVYLDDVLTSVATGDFDSGSIQIDPNDLNLGDGVYTVEFTAMDNAGNSSSKKTPINSDKTIPEFGEIFYDSIVNQHTHDGVDYTTSADGLKVSVRVHDTGIGQSGINEVFYSIDEENWIETTGEDDVYSCEIALEDNEEFDGYVWFKAMDVAGNENSVQSDRIIVDKTPPTITMTQYPPLKWFNEDLDFEVKIYDKNIHNISYTTDEDDPQHAELEVFGEGPMQAREFTLTNNGSYTVTVTAEDAVGTITEKTQHVNIDKKKPVVTDIELEVPNKGRTWVTNNVIGVTIEGNDDDKVQSSGISHYEWSLDGNNWNEINGNSFSFSDIYKGTIKVRAIDIAGNISDVVETEEINIEQTAPVIEIEELSENWYTEPVDVNISIYDIDSDVDIVWVLYKDIKTNTTIEDELILTEDDGMYTTTWTATQNGEYDVLISAYDIAGNLKSETFHIKLDECDFIPMPEVISGYKFDTWTPQNVSMEFNVPEENIPISGIKEFRVTMDNENEEISNGDYFINKNGTHVINVYAISEAGLKSEVASVTVKIDKTIPYVTGVFIDDDTLNDGKYFNEPQIIKVKSDDVGSGVSKVFLKIGEETTELDDSTITLENEVSDDLVFFVEDAVGNRSEDFTVRDFTIDMTNPDLTFNKYESQYLILNSSEELLKKNSDGYITFINENQEYVDSIHISNNRVIIEANKNLLGINLEGILTPGKYTVIIDDGIVCDLAGNGNNESTFEFEIKAEDKVVLSDVHALVGEDKYIGALAPDSYNFHVVIPEEAENFEICPVFNKKVDFTTDIGTVKDGKIQLTSELVHKDAALIITSEGQTWKITIHRGNIFVTTKTSGDINTTIDDVITKSAIDIEEDIRNGAQNIEIVVNVDRKAVEDIPSEMEIVKTVELDKKRRTIYPCRCKYL